jgi:hypothetical protein
MFLNFQLFHSKGLKPEDLYHLLAIKQIEKEVLEKLPSDVFMRLEALSLLTSIKGKKGDNPVYNIRLSKKGLEFFNTLDIPEVAEGDLKMAEYLFSMYLNHEDEERVLGNKKAITKYIAILRNHLDLSLHEFFYLCEYFLAEYPFTKKLENIFLDKNKNRYGEFKNNIDSSVLFQFWEQKEQEIRQYFKIKIKD